MRTKKFYRKIDILFWFFIMFLPILIGIITMIGYSCNYKYYTTETLNTTMIQTFFNGIESISNFIPTFIINTFDNLFTTIGITSNTTTTIAIMVSWFVWVVYLHLLVDILAFIPKFFHNWLRKVDKYEE